MTTSITARWRMEDVETAAAAIRRGALVAFPTETVYGLGGDGTSDEAVAAIYAAKSRPRVNPLILHVTDAESAMRIAALPPEAQTLADRFWPGPLTIVAPVRTDAKVSALALAGLSTIALRAPAHDLAQALLAAVGRPLAAPSANISGRISPTTADHVLAGLSGRVAGVLDGGPCAVGLESSIVGFDGGAPTLLRAGGLPAEEIEAALGRRLVAPGEFEGDAPRAPGQLASHYAPAARLRLDAEAVEPGEVLLGFGGAPGAALDLSAIGDVAEAAANLFAALHELDRRAEAIAVSPIPEIGLGRAINDRLRRAAAPRETPPGDQTLGDA